MERPAKRPQRRRRKYAWRAKLKRLRRPLTHDLAPRKRHLAHHYGKRTFAERWGGFIMLGFLMAFAPFFCMGTFTTVMYESPIMGVGEATGLMLLGAAAFGMWLYVTCFAKRH